tara:strand:- start:359 stop:844 length:486 start_codon:yes stop_codon:yes gene_type:complete
MEIINTNLSINTERISNTKYKVTIQSFPQKNKDIVNYKLVFDMKFRDDYESNFAGVCIGPAWENYGPGEFTMNLNVSNNFKNLIIAEHNLENDDGCQNYFYYLRFLEITTEQNKYLVGVATDYAEEYPDAPHVWKLNNLNVIEEKGNSNIEKYSINFELSN